MPDRYRDAVRARRAELRAEHAALGGGHRAEVRSVFALGRVAAADAAADALAWLVGEVAGYVEHPERAVRRQLLTRLPAALDAVAAEVQAHWIAALRPGLGRIASARRLDLGPDWPPLRAPPPPYPIPGPAPPARSWFAGAVEGLAVWRLALLPAAILPLLGLPVLGFPALAPVAVGAGAAAVVLVARARRAGAERAALRRWVDGVVAAAGAALRADAERAMVLLEQTLSADLDVAVAARRAVVEERLRAVLDG